MPARTSSSLISHRGEDGSPAGLETQGKSRMAGMERTTHGESFRSMDEFFEDVSELTSSREKNIADTGIEFKDVEESLNGFAESAQVLIKGLHALGQIHPFIGVAVGAFVLVVTLDLARRDNDKKVLAVKLQMQNMMDVFFELQHVGDAEERGPDGMMIADRLAGLMKTIAKDIKECGSACDAYVKKNFLIKTVKASVYENRLADFGNLFIEHRKRLELSIAIHTSHGIDSANSKLENQDKRLQSIEEKLDMIVLFRKLDTQRERDVQKFIEDNGGVKACIGNDELLEELVAKSGEPSSRISGRETGRRSNDLPDIRKKLIKELQEDIDEAFHKNMALFERKLDMQSKQLSETVQLESEHIISTLLSGAHDRIIDPDLQKIWKDMGWKGSVKARHFVLALHDYYTDRLNSNESPTVDRESLSASPSPLLSGRMVSTPTMKRRQDDRWALSYINAAYVQPILEAVDDDGTGFVSVKEVNDFVASRPENWSLPHWIAYWAVGWQASITQYKNKIYSLVQSMFRTLEYVLPSNRRAVDEYLFHASFWRIELLLRSTRSVNPKVLSDPDLYRITESYAKTEEERLELNLHDVGYELDTPATVSLITGVGRIERYVFPLIYLLLKRHLKVINLACKHVVDTEEFVSLNESLVSILLAVDYRIQNLEAIFKQTHLDVQARLGNFAFGLFQLSYGDIRRIPINNSFGTWTNEGDSGGSSPDPITSKSIRRSITSIPLEVLKYGIQDGFHSTDYFEFEPGKMAFSRNPIQGTWTGHCARRDGEQVISHVLRISFRMTEDLIRFTGKGEDYRTAFEFEGKITPVRRNTYNVTFSFDDDEGLSRAFNGTLDSENDILTARWSDRRERDAPDEVDYQPFSMRKTPPSLLRYRYTPREFSEDPVRSRWAFACGASLHQAQEKLWSRKFFRARFSERKRFVELTTRALIVSMRLTPQTPLTGVETGELEYLRRELNPSEARFYQALAEFEIQKLPWHPAWGCDWCEHSITRCRILCLQCISEDLSDNVDLCATCIDKTPTKRGFTHDASHPIIKVEQTLHDFDFPRIVEVARATITRTKALFRTIEASIVRQEEERHGLQLISDDKTGATEALCACCSKSVLPPCWVCVVCTRDTYICYECDLKRHPPSHSDGLYAGHTLAHPLVRIRDSAITGQNATAEERLFAMEQRMITLEYKVAESFATMESRFEQHLARLDRKVEERLATWEASAEIRFDTLEAVLRQVAAQTAALPAIYEQVVRDHVRSMNNPSRYR